MQWGALSQGAPGHERVSRDYATQHAWWKRPPGLESNWEGLVVMVMMERRREERSPLGNCEGTSGRPSGEWGWAPGSTPLER